MQLARRTWRAFGETAPSTSCLRRLLSYSSLVARPARPPKVGVLPFAPGWTREDLEAIGGKLYREILRNEPLPKDKDAFVRDSVEAKEVQKKAILKGVRCVYYPHHQVDAKAVFGLEDSAARMYVYLNNYTFPGHNAANLRLTSAALPPADKHQYQSLTEEHLSKKVFGQTPQIFPFLFTPSTLAISPFEGGAAVHDLIAPMDLLTLASIAKDSSNAKTIRFLWSEEQAWRLFHQRQGEATDYKALFGSLLGLESKNATNQIDAQRPRIVPCSVKVDYFSSRPVLASYYIAEYSNPSLHLEVGKRTITAAIPASQQPDKVNIPTVNYHCGPCVPKGNEGTAPRRWTTTSTTFTKTDSSIKVRFVPRVPFASILQAEVDGVDAMSVQGNEDDASSKENTRSVRKRGWRDMFKRLAARLYIFICKTLEEQRNALEEAQMQAEVQQRLQDWVQNALSTDLAALQGEQHRKKYGRGGQPSAERDAGMGPNIDWSNAQTVAPSGCDGEDAFHDHRLFFEQDLKVQEEKISKAQSERISILERHKGLRSGQLTFGGLTAKECIEAELSKRALLRPQTVKDWLASLPPDLREEMKVISKHESIDDIINAVEPEMEAEEEPETPKEKIVEEVVKLQKPWKELDRIREQSAELSKQNTQWRSTQERAQREKDEAQRAKDVEKEDELMRKKQAEEALQAFQEERDRNDEEKRQKLMRDHTGKVTKGSGEEEAKVLQPNFFTRRSLGRMPKEERLMSRRRLVEDAKREKEAEERQERLRLAQENLEKDNRALRLQLAQQMRNERARKRYKK